MLLSFGAKNFFCFKEWAEINLVLNKKVPLEVSHGLDASLTLCLKGANASGKTNALKILSFLGFFCANSFDLKPDKEIPIETFFEKNSSSELFIEFEIENIKYLYELKLTKREVLSEKIYKKEKRRSLIFERNKDQIKVNTLFPKSKIKVFNRINASAISIFRQNQINEFNLFWDFFEKINSNVAYYGLVENKYKNKELIFQLYKEDDDYLNFTIDKLKIFDTGISNIEMKSYKDKDGKEVVYPVFMHNLPNMKPELKFEAQSSGTKSLFILLALYNNVLERGGILALDEFDINLHPDILRHLIKIFENPEINKNKAQLLFSTHHEDIIDLVGKYKTYLFNKENGECYCYRLDELQDLRNDRPITPLYKAGKIGGVPKI